ncbi:unnamed protein product [Leptidea sinapis]|uniref:Uncharacterized protein n=1 Tax=Leptidea sinapis TaxID=189913 RepID=A0A5E4QB00_9NEOP|nr:unnamed protein product [Leptidea sinapis]
MENVLTQMGMPPKQMSQSHHTGGGHKSNAAMSALTLLAFLFFLHILQQCLKEHMTAMSTPQVMIMTAGKEGKDKHDDKMSRVKLDKAGVTNIESVNPKNRLFNRDEEESPNGEKYLMRITTSEHKPRIDAKDIKNINDKDDNYFPG